MITFSRNIRYVTVVVSPGEVMTMTLCKPTDGSTRQQHHAAYFVTLLLTAWTMALGFAHVLEWAPKAHYSGALYTRLQESLYFWFGFVGAVIYVLAVATSVATAVLTRRDAAGRRPVAVAAALEVVAMIVFFTVVYPVNFRFPVHGSGAVPTDWAALRDRWELGHAIGFALFTTAFVLLLLAASRQGRHAGSTPAT